MWLRRCPDRKPRFYTSLHTTTLPDFDITALREASGLGLDGGPDKLDLPSTTMGKDSLDPMLRMSKEKMSMIDGVRTEWFSWPVEHLGEDEHGTWLGARHGNPVRQPDGSREEAQEHDAVWLIAEDAWWLPAFWFTDTTDLTIDICTPPRLDGGVWSFVDLELDLFRSADGRVGIVDQDEFDELALSGHLTDSQVATATEVAHSLLPLVQMEAEPFGGAARAWLRSLRS